MSTFFGSPQLGRVLDIVQQPGLLGDEYDVVPHEYDATTGMLSNSNAGRVRVKLLRNTSGGTLAPGSIVKRDTASDMAHDVVNAGAADPGCAVVDPFLTASVADDERFLGIIYGECDVLTSAAISKGATLGTAASGKAVTNAVTTVADTLHIFGVMIEAATDANQLRKAFVDFRVVK